MDKNTTTPIDIDDLSISVKLDDVDSPNDAEVIRQTLDTLPDLEAWLADADDIAQGELILINRYRQDQDLPPIKTLYLTVTHTDGRSWEGEAEA